MENNCFFAVYSPEETYDSAESIFTSLDVAIKCMKRTKKSRLKSFNDYDQAVDFVLNGDEITNCDLESESLARPVASETSNDVKESSSDTSNSEKSSQIGGRNLKRIIQSGNVELFETTIQNDFKCLLSIGDTPAILQEGARYNALHLAAQKNLSKMCQIILQAVSNPELIEYAYPGESEENCRRRSEVLLDLYLNTPDKAINQTPLHFAATFGFEEVVQVLVSYPGCQKNLPNKYGQTPRDIVCLRCKNTSSDLAARICSLLDDQFFVPVIRATDMSVQPKIGEPFSPTTPPELQNDPLSPTMEIYAYAGPMTKADAYDFHKKWKTPPRNQRENSIARSAPLQDIDKGLEVVGRGLAKSCNTNWAEFWPFLNSYVDIASEKGLAELEKYLKFRHSSVSFHSESISPYCQLSSRLEKINIIEGQRAGEKSEDPVLSCKALVGRISDQIVAMVKGADEFDGLEQAAAHLKLMTNQASSDAFHPRMAALIAEKIENTLPSEVGLDRLSACLDSVVDRCTKAEDYFSSDEGDSKSHESRSHASQFSCVLKTVQSIILENETEMKLDRIPCTCVCSPASIMKERTRRARRILFKKRVGNILNVIKRKHCVSSGEDEDDEEEEFVTAPSSLASSDDEENDEDFRDPRECDLAVFINGSKPSKMDQDVYVALSGIEISAEKYPHIYLWKHHVKVCKEEERLRWFNTSLSKHCTGSPDLAQALAQNRARFIEGLGTK